MPTGHVHVKMEEALLAAVTAAIATNPSAVSSSAKLTHNHPSLAAQQHYHQGGKQPFFANQHAHLHHHPQHRSSPHNTHHHSSHAASVRTHSHS